mgnify:CR=1 FL=1
MSNLHTKYTQTRYLQCITNKQGRSFSAFLRIRYLPLHHFADENQAIILQQIQFFIFLPITLKRDIKENGYRFSYIYIYIYRVQKHKNYMDIFLRTITPEELTCLQRSNQRLASTVSPILWQHHWWGKQEKFPSTRSQNWPMRQISCILLIFMNIASLPV